MMNKYSLFLYFVKQTIFIIITITDE